MIGTNRVRVPTYIGCHLGLYTIQKSSNLNESTMSMWYYDDIDPTNDSDVLRLSLLVILTNLVSIIN